MKFWIPKSFGSRKILCPKNFVSKNIMGPKKMGVQKKLSLKNILSQKFSFPPLPYDIGLSKVGWIGRGGGWDGGSIPRL